jgi:hypothetical protein
MRKLCSISNYDFRVCASIPWRDHVCASHRGHGIRMGMGGYCKWGGALNSMQVLKY